MDTFTNKEYQCWKPFILLDSRHVSEVLKSVNNRRGRRPLCVSIMIRASVVSSFVPNRVHEVSSLRNE